ncbi:tail fiber protein [Escherichia coli]|nr:tail fiber protein [Escherichia coli]
MTLKRLQLIEMPMLCRRRNGKRCLALLSGFTAGKASSAQVNKAIRQASFIAAALAQFVSDKTQRDVLDNGDLPGFVELLGSGFAVEYLSRKNPFGDIKSDGTVQTALENLGFGRSGEKGCGTGENQIPDMSAWKRNPSSNRWRKLPDGTIIQMGISASGPLGSPVNITLPISFSNTNYCVVASYDNARSGVSTMVSFAALPVSPSQFSLMSSVTEQGVNPFAYWIAFGD